MIFGRKTVKGLRQPQWWFAWRPVLLEDGRWAWWQQVWCVPFEAVYMEEAVYMGIDIPMPCVAWRYFETAE